MTKKARKQKNKQEKRKTSEKKWKRSEKSAVNKIAKKKTINETKNA